jgi:predicted nucleotidyltransferase
MIDLNEYLRQLLSACCSAFDERLLYMGLQGSYLRGEADENSDIDVMLLLERFCVSDMDTYRDILKSLGHYEKSCGFICGREEMARWNPLEICQLKRTTKDLYGSLCDYLPAAAREDEINNVKLALGNLYHELCHRYIHADRRKNALRFRGSCKALFFLIQNLYYLESGRFAATKAELAALVSEEDRAVLALAGLPEGYDFDSAFALLFAWCQKAFLRVDRLR